VEIWISGKSYIVTYPISAGKYFNLVLSHHVDHLVDTVEGVDINHLRKQCEHFDPGIERVMDMIPEAQRRPLLVTGPPKSWSSPQKNVVLMGALDGQSYGARGSDIDGRWRISWAVYSASYPELHHGGSSNLHL
jgi:hypothetical protein